MVAEESTSKKEARIQKLNIPNDPFAREFTTMITKILNLVATHRTAKNFPASFYLAVLDQVRASITVGSEIDMMRSAIAAVEPASVSDTGAASNAVMYA